MWFNSCCGKGDADIDFEHQQYQNNMQTKGRDLFSRLISCPVRRVSRGNEAPLSLEIIQTHLISKMLKGGDYNSEDLIEDVMKLNLFGKSIEPHNNWQELEEFIESALDEMGHWNWMTCPSCLIHYI